MAYIAANPKKRDAKFFTIIRGRQCLNRKGLAELKRLRKEKTVEKAAKLMGLSSVTAYAHLSGRAQLAQRM